MLLHGKQLVDGSVTGAKTASDIFLADGSRAMTGQLRTLAGSAGAPGLVIVGALNMGVFSPGADTLAFSVAATERFRLEPTHARFSGIPLELSNIAAPATPSAGLGRLYAKTSDKKLYWKDDTGAEYDLTSAGSGGDAITGQTTTGLADGDIGYLSGANIWGLAHNDGTYAQSLVCGYNAGVAGVMMPAGTVATAAKFTTAGGSPVNGDYVYLAASTDDGGTGAGKLTATPPSTAGQHLVIVGICVDNASYGASKTCKINFLPQVSVLL